MSSEDQPKKEIIPSFDNFFNKGNNMKGPYDKFDKRNQKKQWRHIINTIKNSLPGEYAMWVYVGPIPPRSAPVFSSKKSDQAKKVKLYFAKYKHQKYPRIEVTAYRVGDTWKIGSISEQRPGPSDGGSPGLSSDEMAAWSRNQNKIKEG